MYDNSIHKTSQPTMQPQHMEFAHVMASNISDLPLDQQNEVLVAVLKAVMVRRKAEVTELILRSDELNERRGLIEKSDSVLKKEMESLRVSE